MRAALVALSAAVLLAGCTTAARPKPQEQMATICANEAGWCPLPEGVAIGTGTPCRCFVPGWGSAAGVGRYFLYSRYPGRPVSPYFNPHWTDMPPPPPVIR